MKSRIIGPALLVISALVGTGCQGEANTNRECTPECGGKECGTDGCGGICGICGPGNACNTDFQCESSFCGNGNVDPGETCDSAIESGDGACPSACEDDGNACTQQNFFGAPLDCDARCASFVIINCIDDDGCCPEGCSPSNDLDCSQNCNNGVVDEGESCDPPDTCPTEADCDDGDACTVDTLTGSASNCSAQCSNAQITECVNDDGCCAPGCTLEDDNDCESTCGDAQVTGQETCDNAIETGMDGACPDEAACNDNDACTTDTLEGDAAFCNARCMNAAVTACVDDDGCCPATCTPDNDNDCDAVCDNGTIETGETCDPIASCPTACDDNDACTTDTLMGSAQMCTAECSFVPVTTCSATADQCCAPNCRPDNDADCADLCQTYCTLAATNCTAEYELYADNTACEAACQAMVVGLPTDDSGNTLYCRITNLNLAENDAATYCPNAAADGGATCI